MLVGSFVSRSQCVERAQWAIGEDEEDDRWQVADDRIRIGRGNLEEIESKKQLYRLTLLHPLFSHKKSGIYSQDEKQNLHLMKPSVFPTQ